MPDTNPIDAINTDMETAITAQEAGDFAAAASKARSAWMRIAGLPDSELADERLRWNREAVGQIVAELERRAQTTGALSESRGALFRDIPVTYERG